MPLRSEIQRLEQVLENPFKKAPHALRYYYLVVLRVVYELGKIYYSY